MFALTFVGSVPIDEVAHRLLHLLGGRKEIGFASRRPDVVGYCPYTHQVKSYARLGCPSGVSAFVCVRFLKQHAVEIPDEDLIEFLGLSLTAASIALYGAVVTLDVKMIAHRLPVSGKSVEDEAAGFSEGERVAFDCIGMLKFASSRSFCSTRARTVDGSGRRPSSCFLELALMDSSTLTIRSPNSTSQRTRP